jgi:hypothetical protein
MALRVRGGITGAGNRPAPYEVPKEPWTCSHGHENKGNHTRCFTLGCNERRGDQRQVAA